MEKKHNAHKIYGTTLYIGSMPLETKYGTFEAHTYQNLIHKGYIIALTKGNLDSSELYTRVHSSCVTSETLGSMDCDCVNQLEGALQKISESGAGIFFYLIQEGRGCGYIGKSRACMMVQYHDDKITTFDAYKKLGMKNDYRDYRNIKEVLHLMGLEKSQFVLLTNNPDKIKGLQDIGVNVKSVESIEIEPGPFNQAYLVSKEKTGHILYQTKKKMSKYTVDYEKVKPFIPYSVKEYSRFIHCSSYYIPIKPIKNQMIYNKEELSLLKQENIRFKVLSDFSCDKYLLTINEDDLKKVKIKPYWFKVHMYYDILSQIDYVILTYGDINKTTPHVRVHSESLFNRFPLKEKIYSKKYQDSIESIIQNNSGAIALLYHDGKGAGLGHYVLNHTEDQLKTGTPHELRDFDAVSFLLSQHIKTKKIKILYSKSSRTLLKESLKRVGFEVLDWIINSPKNIAKGHNLIEQRTVDAPNYLIMTPKVQINLNQNRTYYVLGIGSSNAHAQYFCYLTQKYHRDKKVSQVELSQVFHLSKENSTLVIISQGLSPAIQPVLKLWNFKNIILYTSVTMDNNKHEKVSLLKELKKNKSLVINFPIEDEYTTLIRIIGPLCGYMSIYKSLIEQELSLEAEKKILITLKGSEIKTPAVEYFESLESHPNLVMLVSYPLSLLSKNILNKFVEGGFFSSIKIVNYSEFAHGFFQNVAYQFEQGKKTHFIFLKTSDFDKKMIHYSRKMLSENYPIWEIQTELSEDFLIFELEMIMNQFLLKWLERRDIDQVNWSGKNDQKYLYDLQTDGDF